MNRGAIKKERGVVAGCWSTRIGARIIGIGRHWMARLKIAWIEINTFMHKIIRQAGKYEETKNTEQTGQT
jgi:hypothetical protein